MSQFYSSRHWAQFAPKEDTPRDRAVRARENEIREQVKREIDQQFDRLADPDAVQAFRAQRMAELYRAEGWAF